MAIDTRKTKAPVAYLKLQNVWRSRLNIKTKVKLFMASIVPELLFGLEVLTLANKHCCEAALLHLLTSKTTNRLFWDFVPLGFRDMFHRM